MWRVFVVMMGGLFWPMLPAVVACGPELPLIKPVAPAGVKKIVVVEIGGKVQYVRCMLFGGRTNASITIGNETYWLDLRNVHMMQLDGKKVADWPMVYVGELEEIATEPMAQRAYIVNVRAVRKGDPASKAGYVKKTEQIEVRGKLVNDPREILRPYGVHWCITVDGKEYYLHFAKDLNLARLAAKLDGREVVVTGTLEVNGRWNIVHVDRLEAQAADALKITFQRTAGVGDFRHSDIVTLDSASMGPHAAITLRRLIDQARFFELRSTTLPENIPDPPAGYSIALELDGKSHKIWVADRDVTKPLAALLDRLKDMGVEQFVLTLVGMDEAEAKRRIATAGRTFRLGGRDGVQFALTQDWRPERVTVWVEKGKVASAKVG